MTKPTQFLVDELREISLDSIVVNPLQPRKYFSQEELKELSNSILTMGIIHPPVVRPLSCGTRYELISGERRLRAAELGGLKSIPVVIKHVNAKHSAGAALIENIQRVDLNPIEIAKALKTLINQWGVSQAELALKVGKKRSTIANYLRLLTLPLEIQESVQENKVSMGHAKAILALVDKKQQKLLHSKILSEKLNVREAESQAGKTLKRKRKVPVFQKDAILRQLAEKMQLKWGTKVTIQGKGDQGSITIDYYSLDDLDRLMEAWDISI